MSDEGIVFISYAREDRSIAERLYMDLRKSEINAWLDSRCLKAGVNWKLEIPNVIRKSTYFLLLISKHSINKRGYVQKEIREGLEVLSEFPRNQIFIIPVKLDDTDPIDRELHDLNWVGLYPNYEDGLSRILSAFDDLIPEPLIVPDSKGTKSTTATRKAIHKGEEIDVQVPVLVGDRAAVSYTPFRTIEEFFQQFVDRLPDSTRFADTTLSYYFRVDTTNPSIFLGDDLLEKYPKEILLVFQNHYKNLEVRSEGFSISLSFGGEERIIAIPYTSITEIFVPEIGLSINRRDIG